MNNFETDSVILVLGRLARKTVMGNYISKMALVSTKDNSQTISSTGKESTIGMERADTSGIGLTMNVVVLAVWSGRMVSGLKVSFSMIKCMAPVCFTRRMEAVFEEAGSMGDEKEL